jgi:hypothetical protein
MARRFFYRATHRITISRDAIFCERFRTISVSQLPLSVDPVSTPAISSHSLSLR